MNLTSQMAITTGPLRMATWGLGNAIEDYTAALRLDASNADAYYSRGYSRYHLGRYKLAVSGFCDAIILVPNDVEAYRNRGLAYRNDGQYDLAVVDFNHLSN